MANDWAVILEQRGVIRAQGPDLRDFLQGIVSNDVSQVAPDHAIWAALLTPQGKFLHEFFIVQLGEAFLIDCEAARLPDLLKRLSRYRLRAAVDLEDASADFAVGACFGEGTLDRFGLPPERGAAVAYKHGMAYVDPRLERLGVRLVAPSADLPASDRDESAKATLEAYERLRISLGVPGGSDDLEVERSILLENGFEELGGVSFDKGCFIGQELTARTKYRALIKKRLVPVHIEGPSPAPGTAIKAGEAEAGVMRSTAGDMGLALLRLDRLDAGALSAGKAKLNLEPPDWLRL